MQVTGYAQDGGQALWAVEGTLAGIIHLIVLKPPTLQPQIAPARGDLH